MNAFFQNLLMFMLLLTLLACENEAEKNARLSEESDKLDRRIENLNRTIENLKEEQIKNYSRSAKERVGYVYDFQKNQRKALNNQRELVSIEFQEKSAQEYVASVELKMLHESRKPCFIIYLYNKKGLIVGMYYKKAGFFSKKLAPDQLEEQKYTIPLLEPGIPCYFKIDHPPED